MKILYSNLVQNIEKIVGKYRDDGIFVVIDSTVYDIFTDIIESLRSTGIRSVYKIVAVENTKSIDEAVSLWQWLGNEGANRQSLIVNIGGGITTDLGGFVAATFKRGCDFVNIPTTLMAMVDASIGGKTGINFAGLKNEVGVFADPKWILIDTDLIDTLPYTAKADGYAEMLKYGLISDSDLLRQTYDIDLENIDKKLLSNLIKRDIEIKQYLAKIDRYDRNERRALNFGHTFAHAFEALAANREIELTHGHAVAWGMVCELYLSVIHYKFPKKELHRLHSFVKEHYTAIPIGCRDFDEIYAFMQHDKKNTINTINFTLLEDIGKFHCNCKSSKDEIYEALEYVFL